MSPRGSCLQRNEDGNKWCVTCKEWLPVPSFSSHRGTKDKLQSRCKRCYTLVKYGLTKQSFAALLEAQGGGCAVCASPVHGGIGWHVDHDHECCPGQRSCGACVRGVLCHKCNTGIGSLNEDPQIMLNAITYLQRWRSHRSVTMTTEES